MATNATNSILLRQLFDRKSCTYTYLLADLNTRDGLLIDPVDTQIERDLKLIAEHHLNLKYVLSTHVHADHVSATGLIKKRIPTAKAVISAASNASADIRLHHADTVPLGSAYHLTAIATPGHTQGCMSYHLQSHHTHPGCVFTGDTLFVRGCGRTDFQEGDAETLFRSVRDRLFVLPPETVVYPAHDYRGMGASTIYEESHFNPRLRLSNTLEDFKKIMNNLNLAYPQMMEIAVPANMNCGIPPSEP